MKANKLLEEKINILKGHILEIHSRIKEAQESHINLSLDHVNYFSKVDKLLLDKKLVNYERLVDRALQAGKFVTNLLQNIEAYKTKPFQYSYANTTKKRPATSNPDSPKPKQEKFILTEKQKRDKLVDSIFEEMRKNKKIPSYYQNSISRLEKLKLIRDHFQNLYVA